MQHCGKNNNNLYKTQIFKCNKCNKIYKKNGKNYKKHLRVCNIGNKSKQTINNAQILFPLSVYNQKNDEEHQKLNKRKKVYVCQNCGTKYFNLQYYRRHTTNCEAKRSCNICSQLFPTTKDLHNHKRIHLSKEYQCKKCNKKFKRSDSLQHHVDAVHNKIVYTCNKCNKTNLSRSTWFRHRHSCK